MYWLADITADCSNCRSLVNSKLQSSKLQFGPDSNDTVDCASHLSSYKCEIANSKIFWLTANPIIHESQVP